MSRNLEDITYAVRGPTSFTSFSVRKLRLRIAKGTNVQPWVLDAKIAAADAQGRRRVQDEQPGLPR